MFRHSFQKIHLSTLLLLLLLAGCGGGGGGTQVAPPVLTGNNVLPITVDGGILQNYVNGPFVSVTICAPASTTNCQTVDYILLDTGSTGLRLISSVLNTSLLATLPPQTDSNGNNLAECVVFASSYSWGAVRLADVQLSGEKVSSIPIQIIADPAVQKIPGTCSGTQLQNTVATFGANGVLGVSTFQQDCGTACAASAILGTYYNCPSAGCVPAVASLAQQVQNPVAMLTSDNNGVVIDLPAISPAGATNVAGSLILGIGTQSNNTPGNVTSFDLDMYGNLQTQYNNNPAPITSFVDSGSNGMFFDDATITPCSTISGFYCPTTTSTFPATMQGATNGKTASVSFSVANASVLFTSPNTAFNNLAGPGMPGVFDWGLPFFYGKRIYFAIVQRPTTIGLGYGPYVAF